MSDDADELLQYLGTTGFGARAIEKNLEAAYARSRRELPIFTQKVKSKPSEALEDDSDQESLEESSDEDELSLPVTHELILSKHSRPVSSLALDPSGSRLVSGSYDGEVAFWDFAGMGAIGRPFKVLEPFESHQMRSVDFNMTGELLLLTAANWQCKVITREGEDIGETPKGDPYLRNMKQTRGHIGEITSGSWNPRSSSQFTTSSADATIRVWDSLVMHKCLQVLVHNSKVPGAGKVKCTSALYSTDGKVIGGAYVDGTISLWATDGPYHRPMGGVILDAHAPGTETTDLAFSLDGWSVASRGNDCVKLWDRRKFTDPVHVHDSLPNRYGETSVLFSPNNQEILTPVSTASEAYVEVMSAKTLQSICRLPCSSPAIKVLYHTKLNQIITGHANGDVHVLFSPENSVRGAKLVISKAPKARHVDDLQTADIDETAGEVRPEEASSLAQSSGRARNAARKDPKISHMPDLPGTSRFAERKLVGEVVNFRDQDPQKELLKYDEAAKKDPKFFGVYQKNQPVAQFANPDDFEDPEIETPANKKFKFTPRDKK